MIPRSALYLSQGAENTKVSAIIRRARVSRTTFYRYFKDADDVLNQAVIRDFDALMAEFEVQRCTNTPASRNRS